LITPSRAEPPHQGYGTPYKHYQLIFISVSMALQHQNPTGICCTLPDCQDLEASALCNQCAGLVAWIDQEVHKQRPKNQDQVAYALGHRPRNYELTQRPCSTFPLCSYIVYQHQEDEISSSEPLAWLNDEDSPARVSFHWITSDTFEIVFQQRPTANFTTFRVILKFSF
jgi:hypothetical protein